MMADGILYDEFSKYNVDGILMDGGDEEGVVDLPVDIVPPEEEVIVDPVKPAAVVRLVDGDLNGDGTADVLLAITKADHPSAGSTGAWLIQENQSAAWGNLSTLGAGWQIFGLGKTDGSKFNDDVFVYNASTKSLGAWVTDDYGVVAGWKSVYDLNANMNLLALGDFNGDGQSDMLLRSDYGDVGCWFTSGAKQGWNYFQSLGKEWKIAAVGDFNGDGTDDIALTHSSGFAGCWLVKEDGSVKWSDLDNLGSNEVVGAGDFNGDGIDDVLLKNGSYYGAWLVEDGNARGWMGLGNLGSGRTVEQIADFDGDGVDDLRIRVDNGAIGSMLVKGADTLEWHYYGSVGKEWSTAVASL